MQQVEESHADERLRRTVRRRDDLQRGKGSGDRRSRHAGHRFAALDADAKTVRAAEDRDDGGREDQHEPERDQGRER